MLSALARELPPTEIQIVNSQINECKEKLNNFKQKFINIGEIEKGDKLGKDIQNDKYVIYKEGRLQMIWRWLYSEDRRTTFNHINKDFSEFFGYCDTIKNMHYGLTPSKAIENILIEIITNVIPGLYSLKESYNNSQEQNAEKLCCKIDSIILTLIDMKNEIRCKNKIGETNPKIIKINNKGPSLIPGVARSF